MFLAEAQKAALWHLVAMVGELEPERSEDVQSSIHVSTTQLTETRCTMLDRLSRTTETEAAHLGVKDLVAEDCRCEMVKVFGLLASCRCLPVEEFQCRQG